MLNVFMVGRCTEFSHKPSYIREILTSSCDPLESESINELETLPSGYSGNRIRHFEDN